MSVPTPLQVLSAKIREVDPKIDNHQSEKIAALAISHILENWLNGEYRLSFNTGSEESLVQNLQWKKV
jgi:hypothetical protein